MELVINTWGSFLKKKGDSFVIKNGDEIFEVSARRVERILITTGATITTDAIQMAVERNIDIVFLDKYGNPYGRVWHSKLGSTTLIRRRQLELYDTSAGLRLAKEWTTVKIENQIELLKKLKKNRPEKKEELDAAINSLGELRDNLKEVKGKLATKQNTIRGFEGMASKIYFDSISNLLPEKFRFRGRSRNPAKDEFNCLLNYGYGVLYSKVEKACIIAGLDPYVGFLHTDNYNKKSLVFDIIEMFREYVDETVIFLFSKRQVSEECFDKIENGLLLNKTGKALLIAALNETFEKEIKYRARNVRVKNTIQLECHRIAKQLLDRGD